MSEQRLTATDVAQHLATALKSHGQEYALGGAIALGYWSQPRGTIDVDLTLFLHPDQPSQCIRCLQEVGCELKSQEALESLREHGFCRVAYQGVRVDVFLPISPFYETARQRIQSVYLNEQTVSIWDAASLAVFKMMFFRRKDIADVEFPGDNQCMDFSSRMGPPAVNGQGTLSRRLMTVYPRLFRSPIRWRFGDNLR